MKKKLIKDVSYRVFIFVSGKLVQIFNWQSVPGLWKIYHYKMSIFCSLSTKEWIRLPTSEREYCFPSWWFKVSNGLVNPIRFSTLWAKYQIQNYALVFTKFRINKLSPKYTIFPSKNSISHRNYNLSLEPAKEKI